MIAGSAIAMAALFGVAACGVNTPRPNQTGKQTVDGVECIVYNTGNAGGISCNWEAYNSKQTP
jgi:hypothetical protein